MQRYLAYGCLRRTLLDCAPALVLIDLETVARETANIPGPGRHEHPASAEA